MERGMNTERSLWDYLRVIKRRIKIIVLLPIFGLLISWLYASNITPRYATRAQLTIQKNILRIGAGLQRGVISAFEKSALTRMASSKEVSFLAAQYLLDGGGHEFHAKYDNQNEVQLAGMVRSVVQISNIEQSNLIEVNAVGEKPEELADFANAYSQAIIKFFNAERRKNINELKDYLNAQIAKYTDRLSELDVRILALKAPERNLPEGTMSSSESVMSVEKELRQVESTDEELTNSISNLESALKSGDINRILAILPSSSFVNERAELARLSVQLRDLLKQFTESHPKVERARAALNSLRASLLESTNSEGNKLLSGWKKKLEDINIDKARLNSERAMISSAIASLPDRLREEGTLVREQSVVTSVIQMFRNRLEDLDLSLSTPSDRIELFEPASVPQKPFYPATKLIIGMGFAISLIFALAIAFILESLDTSLFELRDVERLIEKPILAVIPPINIDADKVNECKIPIKREMVEKLPLVVDPRSPSSEAYRTLRTVINNRFTSKGKKTLLITSTTPQEGKTTTIVNLSLACADAGMKTCLVGANLRHPIIGRFFAIDRTKGLHEILTGTMPPENVVQPTGYENLDIIDSGSFARRPAELLAKPELEKLFSWLKERYEIILIDSPPTLPVADSATIAPKVDGILLVYLVSVAPRDALVRCKNILEEVGGNIIGVVFNDIWGASQADYAGYYYYHRYASDEFRRI